MTGASICYIGQVCKPIKGISKGLAEDADMNDHIIKNAKDQIKFISSSQNGKFMIDKVLKQDEGLTYNLFRKDVQESFINEGGKDEKTGIIIPRHIYIK